jgi:hypothetical protein
MHITMTSNPDHMLISMTEGCTTLTMPLGLNEIDKIVEILTRNRRRITETAALRRSYPTPTPHREAGPCGPHSPGYSESGHTYAYAYQGFGPGYDGGGGGGGYGPGL